MQLKKKTLALLIGAATLVSSTSGIFAASGGGTSILGAAVSQDGLTFTSSSESVKKGETFTVTVSTTNTSMTAIEGGIQYDDSVFTLNGYIVETDVFPESATDDDCFSANLTDNPYEFAFENSTEENQNTGNITSFEFTAKEDAVLGSYSIKLQDVVWVDYDINQFFIDPLELTVEIAEETVDISEADVVIPNLDYVYEGSPVTPEFSVSLNSKELIPETDYTFEYSENEAPGTGVITVTGTGMYTGTVVGTFLIREADPDLISISDAVISGIEESYEYTGSPIDVASSITVTVENPMSPGEPIVLQYGDDFEIEYSPDNINVGTVTVTVKGINGYSGTVTAEFEITDNGEEPIKGDYDRDGEIILRYDLLVLKRALNDDPTVESIDSLIDVGDLNADGDITMSEVTDFKRHDVEYSGYEDLNLYYNIMDQINNKN